MFELSNGDVRLDCPGLKKLNPIEASANPWRHVRSHVQTRLAGI